MYCTLLSHMKYVYMQVDDKYTVCVICCVANITWNLQMQNIKAGVNGRSGSKHDVVTHMVFNLVVGGEHKSRTQF